MMQYRQEMRHADSRRVVCTCRSCITLGYAKCPRDTGVSMERAAKELIMVEWSRKPTWQ
jgi:hypothetical protein